MQLGCPGFPPSLSRSGQAGQGFCNTGRRHRRRLACASNWWRRRPQTWTDRVEQARVSVFSLSFSRPNESFSILLMITWVSRVDRFEIFSKIVAPTLISWIGDHGVRRNWYPFTSPFNIDQNVEHNQFWLRLKIVNEFLNVFKRNLAHVSWKN